MGNLLHSLYALCRRIGRKLRGGNNQPSDPFAALEAKGLKIAASSKKRMHSPWGLDGLAPWLIEIGEDCMISTNVQIMTHDASTAIVTGCTRYGRVKIGNRVFLGHAVTVLPGVTIGDDVVVGTGAVVTKDLPSNGVYGGNPARFICKTDDYRKRKQAEIEAKPFFEHNWSYWQSEATMEEREAMRAKLDESRFGYIKSDSL